MTRLFAALASAALLAQAPTAKAVWVLEAPNRIVQYDTTTFEAQRTVLLPPRVLEHPEYLRVNAHGQMLFAGAPGVGFTSSDLAATATRVWVWDGREAHEFPREDEPDTARTWFLSAAGDALYAFENRFAITRDRDGLEREQRASGRLWRTDLTGGRRQVVLDLGTTPRCTCDTGSCSASCPEWDAWAPLGIVDRLVLITQYVPGQLQTTTVATTIYRRDGRGWRPRALPAPIEAPLTVSADGNTLATAKVDASCCGWINESSDQLVLLRNGAPATLYDEFARFGNRDYDASIAPVAARFSPDGRHLAYLLAGDAPPPDEDIRLSAEGKDNPAALARLRAALATMPAVEIVNAAGTAAAPAVIPRAVLAGWLDNNRILVIEAGRLAVYSVAGAKVRDTPVAAAGLGAVFLR